MSDSSTSEETTISYDPSQRTLSRNGETSSEIPLNRIIAIAQLSSDNSNYTVLYTSDNPDAKDDPAISPLTLQSFTSSQVPLGLLDELPSSSKPFLSPWLQANTDIRPRLHVVVSTGSGTGQAASAWKLLLRPLFDQVQLSEGEDYNLYLTTSETAVSDITQTIVLPLANQGVSQVIILLSGDGGMVDIVNALLSDVHSTGYIKPSVCLLPLGTGNALAHSSGITADSTMGLRSLWQGSPTPVPVFRASFSPGARYLVNEARETRELRIVDGKATAYGAVVLSWAFHAGLVADSDTAEYRKFGAERFKMAGKEALFPSDGSPPHAYRGKISVLSPGSTTWRALDRDTHLYVLATFCSHLEKGFNISPESLPLDQQLRLIHFGPLSAEEAMGAMGKAYDGGKHVNDERIQYDAIDGMRIDFEEADARWRRICLDGTIISVEKGGWVEMKSGINSVVDLVVIKQ